MLKLNYNDYGLFLERVTASLDAIATQRVMLAVYAGKTLHLEPGRAAFLVPAKTTGVGQLETVLQSDATQAVTLTDVDDEFVEVSLKGTWIADNANAEAGTFITALTPVSEAIIYQLWQVTQRQAAFSV
ncbi:MAG: alr0857 family protein [Cyanobacteria bacterium J06581_3]